MIAILLLSLLAGPAWSETLILSSPRALVCHASPDAEFVLDQGGLRPIRGTFTFSPPGEPPLEPLISVPAGSEPGGAVRVAVSSSEALDGLVASLTDERGRQVARTTVFRLSAQAGADAWAALVGIPSTAAPGQLLIEVKASAGDRSCLLRAPLAIAQRAFASETIPLDAALSTLRTTPDPRKAEEAHALARLLATPHADSLFEQGAFMEPLAAGWRRTAAFGDRRRYRYANGGSDVTVHNGIDMASPLGTGVAACGKGKVVLAGERILTGKTVVVEHLPGLFSIYYHLSELLVREGDLLAAGQPLGKVGQTGLATGPHLHWEVQILGTAVDPEALVRRPVLDTQPAIGDIQARN